MNKDKEIIDQFLKQKVEEASYQMKEAHWQHALKALQDEGDKVGGWAYWYKKVLLGLGLIVLTAISYLAFNYNSKAAKELPIVNAIAAPQSNTESTIAQNTNSENLNSTIENSHDSIKSNTSNLATSNNTFSTTNSSGLPNDEQPKAQNNTPTPTSPIAANEQQIEAAKSTESNNAITTAETIESNKSVNSKAAQSNKLSRIEKKLAARKTKQVAKQDNNITNTDEQANLNPELENLKEVSLNNNSSTLSINTKQEKRTKRKQAKKLEPKTPKAEASANNNNADHAMNEANKPQTNSVNKKPILAGQADLNNSTFADSKKATIPHLKSNPRFVAEEDRIVTNIIRPKDTIGNEVDSKLSETGNSKDATINIGNAPEEKVEKVKTKKQRNYTATKKGIIVSAGLNTAQAPLSLTVQNKTFKASPVLGLGYNLPINKRFQLQAFVAGTYIQALRDPYTVVKYNYGFGAQHQTFNISEQSILQIQLPMTLQYQFLPKHFAGIGISPSFNAGVLSKVKDFNTNYYVNRWGYNQFYNPFNFFGQLNYQYLINSKLALSMQYLPGFTDVTNNTFNRNTLRDNTTRFIFGVNFNFGK